MNYRNLSATDRTVRIVLGLIMLVAGWTHAASGIWNVALEVFGWVPLMTGAIGWCPIYALLGFSTLRARDETRSF